MARTLAEAARRLKQTGRFSRTAGSRPALFVMTDDTRLPDPSELRPLWRKDIGVIVRRSDGGARREVFLNVRRTTRRHGVPVLIAADVHLAIAFNAEGVHVPEAVFQNGLSPRVRLWRRAKPGRLVTTSAHSLRALNSVSRAPCDAVFLSPVFATASHPGRGALGVTRTRLWVKRARRPVIALGGITRKTVAGLTGSGVDGVAAIGGILDDAKT